MGKDRLLLVSCRNCRVLVTAASHFGAEEVEALLAHLRFCKPGTRLPDEAAGVGTVLKYFTVRTIDRRA